jgi:hypothetical protein
MTPFDTILTRVSALELPLDFDVGKPRTTRAGKGLEWWFDSWDIGAPCDCPACEYRGYVSNKEEQAYTLAWARIWPMYHDPYCYDHKTYNCQSCL